MKRNYVRQHWLAISIAIFEEYDVKRAEVLKNL
jgi:hypothetical protein